MKRPAVIPQQQKQYVYLHVNMNIYTQQTADKLHWLFKTRL